MHNRMEYRPLEGFVLAITPFNFTAIGGNLPTSAAMCGNVVVWKPAHTQIYSAQMFMRILKEAGLPDGVINFMWETIGKNTSIYKSYPRIVGETGGKDFVIAHKTADPDVVVTALLRGAFEFQGQKCSAASRAYIPSNIAAEVKKKLVE